VSHPVFLTHPITGRKVLYCNPGYAIRINELPERDSDDMLEYLFDHQLQPRSATSTAGPRATCCSGTISAPCTTHMPITATTSTA
jgi:alpha-ketoglutarate-dependent taurine dioxygenase